MCAQCRPRMACRSFSGVVTDFKSYFSVRPAKCPEKTANFVIVDKVFQTLLNLRGGGIIGDEAGDCGKCFPELPAGAQKEESANRAKARGAKLQGLSHGSQL